MMTYAEMEQLARGASELIERLYEGFKEHGWEGHAQRTDNDATLYQIYEWQLKEKQE
jgi:hypothetical protein